MLITKQKRKKIRTVIPVTKDLPLRGQGKAGILSIPVIFTKALGWSVGSTVIRITLNQDSTITLEAAPSKKPIGKPPELPLFEKK